MVFIHIAEVARQFASWYPLPPLLLAGLVLVAHLRRAFTVGMFAWLAARPLPPDSEIMLSVGRYGAIHLSVRRGTTPDPAAGGSM